MAKATLTVVEESRLPESCPLRNPAALAAYYDALQAGARLSLASKDFLKQKDEAGIAEWLGELMDRSRAVFQPWTMEILYVAGVLGEVRFSTLERMLGLSSRTLAAKLKLLVEAGLLERRVESGPPVKVAYRLSKNGRATAAAASPLFAQLNLVAAGVTV